MYVLLINSVVANTCLKNGKLTAFVYQYSDSQVKCYTWCFGSALQSPISHIQGRKKVNPDKVLILIKSSLWQSTEARTLSGFDCITIFAAKWSGKKVFFCCAALLWKYPYIDCGVKPWTKCLTKMVIRLRKHEPPQGLDSQWQWHCALNAYSSVKEQWVVPLLQQMSCVTNMTDTCKTVARTGYHRP